MAIYHLSVKPVSRGVGRSSTAASAYRAAVRVADERTGETFDYTRKRGVEHAEIVLPSATAADADWALDRQQLWNAAERAEQRKDARVAREYEVALPYELNAAQRLELVRAFAHELADRHGCAVDLAVHAPHRAGDTRNHHAHLLATTRAVATAGLTTKTDIELKDADRAKKGLGPARTEVTAIRSRWAELVNEHLAEHGHAARIDHRSLDAQGIDREPTSHKGPAVTAIERRGEQSRVSERIREDITERLRVAAELGRLERESSVITRSIVDTTADLNAAISARDAERVTSVDATARELKPSMPDIRRVAQTQWLALLAEQGRAERQTTQHRPAPTLDLTGDVAAAATSRSVESPSSTREQAHAAWLSYRAEQSNEPSAAEKSTPRIILPDHDHTLK